MITIAITSFNRGKYLGPLLESIYEECQNDNHQLIIVDNFSSEKLVFDVLEKYKFLECPQNHSRIFVRQDKENHGWVNDEYSAKNLIIQEAIHDVILFIQDDHQFIGYKGSIEAYAKAFIDSQYACLTSNAVRRSTLKSKHTDPVENFNDVKIWRYNDNHYHTMGFFKKSVFKLIGEYPTNLPLEQRYWGYGENWYNKKVNNLKLYKNCVSATTHIPLFLPILNDPRGGYSFIRNNKRYGYYLGPSEGEKLFYQKLSLDDYQSMNQLNSPISFVDIAKPIGWKFAINSCGDLCKYPQSRVIVEGPIEEINSD